MKYILLEEVDSTNSYVSVHAGTLEDMTVVGAAVQTAGRGQRGNSWESEPGRNLTFTIFHVPGELHPRDQFAISEATALGVVGMLGRYGIEAKVKWPNDVYVGDRKISGILIEHSVASDRILHSRIGVGLNVNQQAFHSDAPNPISMIMLTERELPLSEALAAVCEEIRDRLEKIRTSEGRARMHEEFLSQLWRGDGLSHPFRRREDGKVMQARIADVAPSGLLALEDAETGEREEYAFKEVEFLLDQVAAIQE